MVIMVWVLGCYVMIGDKDGDYCMVVEFEDDLMLD